MLPGGELGQILQLAGALAVLAAYVLGQMRILQTDSNGYLWPNLLGSALLAILAWTERQWGFLLLEGVWALVSAWSLARRLRARPLVRRKL